MKLKFKLMLMVLALGIGLGLITLQSYALWVATYTGGENIVDVGCFQIEFTENTEPLSLKNTYPMSDSKGMSGTPYTFTITNKCTVASNYQVTLNTLTTNGMTKDKIKYAVYKSSEAKPGSGINLRNAIINTDTSSINVPNLAESFTIASGELRGAATAGEVGGSVTYNLYIWIDSIAGNEVMNKNFEASVNIITAAKTLKLTGVDIIEDLAKNAPKDSTEVYTVPDLVGDGCTYTLAYDGTADNNLRYVGANPCNYVDFNGEKWRIIGAMNNIDDGTGKKETRIKLIRNESIGGYSWDSSASAINNSFGINQWGPSTNENGSVYKGADLMKLLNPGYENEAMGGSLYYNSKSGNCYSSSNEGKKACNFTITGLKGGNSLIGDAKWNVGSNGNNDYNTATNGLASHFYTYERSNDTGKICISGSGCNDVVNRTTDWIGKVGLMYPSDYGYATSGGATTNRGTCLGKEMYNWDDRTVSDCPNNDWLYNGSSYQWTLSPFAYWWDTGYVFYVSNDGFLNYDDACSAFAVLPVVYLTSKTTIFDGDGSLNNSYKLK